MICIPEDRYLVIFENRRSMVFSILLIKH